MRWTEICIPDLVVLCGGRTSCPAHVCLLVFYFVFIYLLFVAGPKASAHVTRAVEGTTLAHTFCTLNWFLSTVTVLLQELEVWLE